MKHTLALAALLLVAARASPEGTWRENQPSPWLHRIDPQTPPGLQQLLAPAEEALPFVSAHGADRGRAFPRIAWPPSRKPSGTLCHHGNRSALHERRRDCVAPRSHAGRTTTGRGRVADFTLAELKQLKLKDTEGNVTEFEMPTLDEALAWARGTTILVLDQKDVPVAARVRKIAEHKAEAYAILIVNNFQDAQRAHALNKNIMMEVMIPNLEKAKQFGQLGIPWQNIVVFVGHTPPEDAALYEFVHAKARAA